MLHACNLGVESREGIRIRCNYANVFEWGRMSYFYVLPTPKFYNAVIVS